MLRRDVILLNNRRLDFAGDGGAVARPAVLALVLLSTLFRSEGAIETAGTCTIDGVVDVIRRDAILLRRFRFDFFE